MDRMKKDVRFWLSRRFNRESHVTRACPHNLPLEPPPETDALQDICRLGGLSLLHLPHNVAAARIALPAALAALATFLLENGQRIPGVFRIPGNRRTVIALHNHFALQIQAACRYRHTIETTISNARLPPNLIFSVHDAASAFKKFLSEIPGGILGSLHLFDAICAAFPRPPFYIFHERRPHDRIDAGRAAQTILALHSSERVALVTAVFGLLAYFRREVGPPSDGSMSARALGIVFAPLLLGNLTEGIPVQREYIRAKSYPGAGDTSYSLASSIQRLNVAATVIELLITSWEDVVWHIRCLQPEGACYLPWPSTPNPPVSGSRYGTPARTCRRPRGASGVLFEDPPVCTSRDSEETTLYEEDVFVTALSFSEGSRTASQGSRTASYHSVLEDPRQEERFGLPRRQTDLGLLGQEGNFGLPSRPATRTVRSFSLPLLSSRSQLSRD